MANIKISELNELYEAQKDYNDYVPVVDTSADETKKISVKNLIRSNVQLIAVTDTEPAEYETGDKYYNTTDNRIYTATSSGWANAETPIRNIFYVVLGDENTTYTYDMDNEILVSVGGGASGGGGETLPVGTVLEFPTTDSTKVPDGWLFCDGSAVSRTTYADLFAIIGTSFGAGDGSTTFNLPTKEGLVSVGIDENDTDFDTIGKTGGSKYLQDHKHIDIQLAGNHLTSWNSRTGSTGILEISSLGQSDGTANQNYFLTGNVHETQTGNSGNLQPYTVTNYIIKATQTTPVQAEVVNDYSTSQENAYSCDYVNKLNTYSTDEIRVGTWIDGKPIYRRVIDNISVTLTANTWTSIYNSSSLNIGSLIDLKVARNNFYDWINPTNYRASGGSIDIRYASAETITCLILEYTKTTD